MQAHFYWQPYQKHTWTNTVKYVDDLICGKDDVPSALNISITAEKIMQEAEMSLRKWISNSNELMKEWKTVGFKQFYQENLRNGIYTIFWSLESMHGLLILRNWQFVGISPTERQN